MTINKKIWKNSSKLWRTVRNWEGLFKQDILLTTAEGVQIIPPTNTRFLKRYYPWNRRTSIRGTAWKWTYGWRSKPYFWSTLVETGHGETTLGPIENYARQTSNDGAHRKIVETRSFHDVARVFMSKKVKDHSLSRGVYTWKPQRNSNLPLTRLGLILAFICR